MAARCSNPGTETSAPSTGNASRAAFERGAEVVLEIGVGSIEKFPARNDDQIQSRGLLRISATEDLANEALRTVPMDGVSELSRRHDTEPGGPALAGCGDDGQVAPAGPLARFEDALELGALQQPAIGAEAL